MGVTAKGPPYVSQKDWNEMSSQDIHDYYKGFGVHKPIIPEVEERTQEVVWKKVDPQIARDMWLDSQFLDGTTVREVLEEQKTLDNDPDLETEWGLVDEDGEEATVLADLLHHKAPWEKKHQVGGTHYSDLSIQPWDAMRAWFTPAEYASYHIGSVIGYLSRHRKKGGLSDIKKAHHHLSELIRYFEEEEEYE